MLHSTHRRHNSLAIALVTLGIVALSACSERSANEAERTAAAAGNKAAELAETARDKTRAFINSPETRQDAEAVKNAIKNAGSAAVSSVDDAAITLSVTKALAKDTELSAGRIDVDTKDGVVRLAGPAPSAAAKARASELAAGVQGVKTVDNALEVKAM